MQWGKRHSTVRIYFKQSSNILRAYQNEIAAALVFLSLRSAYVIYPKKIHKLTLYCAYTYITLYCLYTTKSYSVRKLESAYGSCYSKSSRHSEIVGAVHFDLALSKLGIITRTANALASAFSYNFFFGCSVSAV